MTVQATYLVDVAALQFAEGSNSAWVHALPHGSYKHPLYGTIDITVERVKNFMESVKKKIRGIDPSVNYHHEGDGEAAGWVKDADSRSDGLWLFVEFTTTAVQKIKEKAFKYFSSEIYDEWEDAQGNKHKDVLFGGALTNRPFMKNLVPLNLSETTTDNAYDLVSLLSGTPVETLKGGKMELSDEDLDKLVTKLAEKLAPKDPPKPTPTAPPKLSDIPELKELAEENPMVAALIQHVEAQNADIASSAQKLKEAQINQKLAEFDRSKIVLTPVAKRHVVELLDKMPMDLSEDFWNLLKEMKKSSAFLVELGERAGTTVNYGSAKTAAQQFAEITDVKVKAGKTYSDAVEEAATENPELYKRYRNEQYEGANR